MFQSKVTGSVNPRDEIQPAKSKAHKKSVVNFRKYLDNRSHIILICGAFLIVYALALTFVYIEGDDASIISYHLLGRDDSLRSRYAIYQAMFDSVLSIFPAKEPLLRIFSISLSAFSACIATLLAVNITSTWRSLNQQKKLIYALSFLVLSPELFFSGLYINPTIVGLAFIFGAQQVLLKRDEQKQVPMLTFLISAALFGIGVSLRWSLLLFGITIFLDLFLSDEQRLEFRVLKISRRNVFQSLSWLSFAFVFTSIFIGWSIRSEISTLGIESLPSFIITLLKSENVRNSSPILLARMLSLFSPVLIIISVIGFWRLVKQRSLKFSLMFFIQFLFIFFFIKAGRVKETLVLLPVLWVVFIEGVEKLLITKRSAVWLFSLSLLAISPWFFGINVYSQTTRWGPGFEIRQPDPKSQPLYGSVSNNVVGDKFGFSSISPMLRAGFALTTPEGPRPLGGYAHVLLGGEWRNFTLSLDQYLQEIAQAGVDSGKIIKLGAGSDANLVNKLLQNGYEDYSPMRYPQPDFSGLPFRSVTNLNGETTMIYYAFDVDVLLDTDICIHQPDLCDQPIPLMTNYTSDLNYLYHQLSGEQISILSPISGSLYLDSQRENN